MPLYYSQPEIVETIANKRKQREAFKKWEESNVIIHPLAIIRFPDGKQQLLERKKS